MIKNRNKGITLVALVITIIILLILAGISIASLTSSGLFNNARRAEEEYSKKQEEENSILREYENLLGEYMPWTPPTYKNINIIETNPSAATPTGATVIEADATNGIVIRDTKNNEWTWVVVPKSIYTDSTYTVANNNKSVTSSTDYEGIYNVLNKYAETYRKEKYIDEWYDGCGLATEVEYTTMYNKMLSSVYINGGFWITRYEAGIENSEELELGRTSHTDITNSSPKVVSKANMIPYNFVTCSEAQILASAMSTDSTKTSSLLFGIQWDLVCKYLEGKQGLTVADINSDSKAWGNYADSSIKLARGKYNTNPNSSTNKWTAFNVATNYVDSSYRTSSNIGYFQLLTTGASDDTKKMNIYDLAGNEYEWTLEHATTATSDPCSDRGGDFSDSGAKDSAAHCLNYSSSNSKYYIAFRCALY